MFIKIVHWKYETDEKGTNRVSSGTEEVFQCHRYYKQLVENKATGEKEILLTLEADWDGGHHTQHQFERKALSIFILNDEGSTIDSINYGPQKRAA